LLKKDKFVWDEKCQRAFEDIKQYLLNPPILVPMYFLKLAYLYISITQGKIIAFLTKNIISRFDVP